ncbi:type IV secretion system protein [Allopontixanthobacter sp.]|uniref:type IV secretion system protein n=1 Tax=Allopontixanthobacter sp. TaxID=2906452 RepID=UPI002ABC8637|nr:type IV secretion system protein [Allopontixanthobacter sp.]MDZ4307417.1 type IV secretion system protein [Allopontixanthobacter sp.]
MNVNCQDAANAVGNGVAAALQGVDCVAAEMTGEAFGRLFAPGGALGPVLTILLGLFIALFAIGLLLGRTNLSVRSMVPRMITLGLVVTFATSWIAYQAVVWNLAIAAPDYLASTLTGDAGSATTTFANKIDVVFTAIEQATTTQAGGQEGAGAGAGENISAFSPKGMLWLGAMLLLLGTVGVLVTARIGLAVLVALGPVFVVMALFNGTRGLFTGWLKGVVMLALTPLFAVLGGSVMLELAVPVLSSLALTPGEVAARPAMAFFMIGAVHVALMIMVLKVSATMVSGWRVFGLVPDRLAEGGTQTVYTIAQTGGVAGQAPVPAGSTVGSPSRQIPISAVTTGAPANDPGTGLAPAASRETRIFTNAAGSGQVQPLTGNPSRTRGIGTRFRSPGTKPAAAAGNSKTETFQ